MEENKAKAILFFSLLIIINILFLTVPNVYTFIPLLCLLIYFCTIVPLSLLEDDVGGKIAFFVLYLFIMFEYINFYADKNLLDVFHLVYIQILRLILPTYIISLIAKFIFQSFIYQRITFSKFYPKNKGELDKEDNMWISIVSFLQGFLSIGVIDDNSKFIVLLGMLIFNIPRAIGHVNNNSRYRLLSILLLWVVLIIDSSIIITNTIPSIDFIKNISQNTPFNFVYFLQVGLLIFITLITAVMYAIFEKRYNYDFEY